ncbi:MAG: MmcQ/YjbR family DNA-binding protein [Gammaproteobacteria bacterium]|nr:MmcQ/YjbR family DNA-binding protein [Gammaproteobacteria bacterium]
MSKRSPTEAVHDLCLAFDDSEAHHSHGFPDFRVNGKVFAQYAVNHHGDGRVALWLNSPDGSQQDCVAMDSESYFVPPYLGPRGWLGVNLDKNLSWDEIQYQVAEAYLHTSRSTELIEDVIPDVPPPTHPIDPVEFDAFNDPDCRRQLEKIRSFCFSLPEVTEVPQFGNPSFKAGKKTFATAYVVGGAPCAEIWVGKDQQSTLITDDRFSIPRYTGHNGWIQLKLKGPDCMDIFRELAVDSYKHFALKRMLKELEEDSK